MESKLTCKFAKKIEKSENLTRIKQQTVGLIGKFAELQRLHHQTQQTHFDNFLIRSKESHPYHFTPTKG